MFEEPKWLADHSNYPEMEFGRSYLFYSILENELVAFTKLPGLNLNAIPLQIKETKFGVYDAAPNKHLRKDHYRIETKEYSSSVEFGPTFLQSDRFDKKICFRVSWHGDLEYIGEV